MENNLQDLELNRAANWVQPNEHLNNNNNNELNEEEQLPNNNAYINLYNRNPHRIIRIDSDSSDDQSDDVSLQNVGGLVAINSDVSVSMEEREENNSSAILNGLVNEEVIENGTNNEIDEAG